MTNENENSAMDQLEDDQKAFIKAAQRGAADVADSLTELDEMAIKVRFGQDLEDLPYLTTLRAFVFILERRRLADQADEPASPTAYDATARETVKHMRSKAVQQQLADHGGPDEVLPDDPDSPQGKDELPTSSELTS